MRTCDDGKSVPFVLLGDCGLGADDEAADDSIVEAEAVLELVDGCLLGLNVHQNVVSLAELLDGIGKLPAAPVLKTLNLTAGLLDNALVALDHSGNLFALIRMDHEHNFIMTHLMPLMDTASAARSTLGKGKERLK